MNRAVKRKIWAARIHGAVWGAIGAILQMKLHLL